MCYLYVKGLLRSDYQSNILIALTGVLGGRSVGREEATEADLFRQGVYAMLEIDVGQPQCGPGRRVLGLEGGFRPGRVPPHQALDQVRLEVYRVGRGAWNTKNKQPRSGYKQCSYDSPKYKYWECPLRCCTFSYSFVRHINTFSYSK